MPLAKPACPPTKAVLKASVAPGATSATICNIARPSSLPPEPKSCSTITPDGKSPEVTSAAAPPKLL